MKSVSEVNQVFRYHEPDEEQIKALEAVRSSARAFAGMIVDRCPPCADRSAALRKVREALMTANASIVLRGKV